ncbi:MAG: acyloxyacyl hydrolase [Draconibacterium sp.]
MIRTKQLLLILTALFIVLCGTAQESSRFDAKELKKDKNYGWQNYIQINGYKGVHLVEGGAPDLLKDGFWGGGLRVGTQATGRKEWQRLHAYPQYGFGVSFFNLGGLVIDSLLGKPTSFYFFYGEPIVRFGKYRLNADVEVGIATDFKPYDPETNVHQVYIGAKSNLHFNFSFQMYYELTKRMDLAMGLSFMHFSNGRTFTPQHGINLLGLNLAASYHYNPVRNFTKYIAPDYQPPIRATFIDKQLLEFKPQHDLIFMTSIGTMQESPGKYKNELGELDTTVNRGPRYLTSSLSVEYAWHFEYRLKAVAGLDMFYDGSTENYYENILPQNTTFTDKSFYGTHVGIQYLIERITFMFQYGRYLYKPFERRGKWYMRVGGRVGITEHAAVHIALKTRNGGSADWIEWGLAYKINTGALRK